MIFKKLKNARIAANITQSQLARKIGLKTGGTQYISNVERGMTAMSPAVLKGYCKAVGFDYNYAASAMIDQILESHRDVLNGKYGLL